MLKLILVFLIIFLIVRAFIIAGMESNENIPRPENKEPSKKPKKGVPIELGEYVEYEEVERRN
jgi:biopolymer transport protein ExbD